MLHVAALPAGAPLVDFPLLVVLDDQRAARDSMRADASDVRFYTATGDVLAAEIEQVGAAGGAPLIAWVRVPSLAQGLDLIVAYGADPDATSTDAAWSDEFAGVWHLDGSGDAPDSTPNLLDGAATGTTAIAGIVGGARLFTRADPDWIAIASGAGLVLSTATVSGWLDLSTQPPGGSNYAIVSREVADAGNDDFWLADNVGFAGVEFSTTGTGDFGQASSYALTIGAWTHVVATIDGANATVYVDGAPVETFPMVGPLVNDTRPIFIGADRNGFSAEGLPDVDYADGAIDEVRIETVARTAAWIAADDLAQRDQLLTYGPVQYGPR